MGFKATLFQDLYAGGSTHEEVIALILRTLAYLAVIVDALMLAILGALAFPVLTAFLYIFIASMALLFTGFAHGMFSGFYPQKNEGNVYDNPFQKAVYPYAGRFSSLGIGLVISTVIQALILDFSVITVIMGIAAVTFLIGSTAYMFYDQFVGQRTKGYQVIQDMNEALTVEPNSNSDRFIQCPEVVQEKTVTPAKAATEQTPLLKEHHEGVVGESTTVTLN